jgi:parvulin-like peptidyl-prolyl isomerase
MEASHILVAYEGALRAKAEVTRSKAEALVKAQDLYRALQDGANLAEVARTESDCSSAPRGGYLGSFEFSHMVRPFSEAVAALPPGEFCLVETRFGYHLVMRR